MTPRIDNTCQILVNYQLVRSSRRTLALIVHDDGSLEVRCPLKFPQKEIDRYIRDKTAWIEQKRQINRRRVMVGPLSGQPRAEAEKYIYSRFETLSGQHDVSGLAAVKIRDQRSRWGSCSSKGTIALNSRCACLPPLLLDYVIQHELCHLQHMNHGPAFWAHLESILPGSRQLAKKLSFYRLSKERQA